VPAMFIGARGGPPGIAFAEVTVAVLMITPRLRSACRASPVGRSLVLSTLARPLIAAGLMTLVLLAAAPALGRLDVPARLAVAAALAFTAFAAVWLVLPGGRAFAADLAADLRSALRPASPAAAAA